MTKQETPTSDPNGLTPTEEALRTLPRRSMLVGIAAAGVSLPFLVSCGSSDNSGSGGPATNSSPHTHSDHTRSDSPPSSTGGGEPADVLTPVAAVQVGGGVILPKKHTVVTQPTQGEFKGFSSTCTHMGCTVANIQDGKIICPCHGSMYSITDGKVLGGPAPAPLPSKPVKVEGANVVSA